jgi:large subunit ribosomal protein L16
MLQPKRVKFRKVHKGRVHGQANDGNTLAFGDFGMQTLEPHWITAAQLEAARRAITRHIRRGGKVWTRVFPDKPMTKKAAETRMGGGKGSPDHWVVAAKSGRILFEMAGVSEKTAKEAIRLAAYKLPIHTRFVVREGLMGTVTAKESSAK